MEAIDEKTRLMSRRRRRLLLALIAAVMSHLAISIAALLRTGEWNWVGDVGRPAILALLALLAIQGRSWARWALIVWLSLSALAFFAGLFTAGVAGAGFVVMLLFVVMAALSIWAVVELTTADLSGPSSKTV